MILKNICDIKGGKRLPKGYNLSNNPNNHPYIRVRNLNNFKLELNQDFEFVPDNVFPNIKNYIVDKNDIIISIVGTIGLISYVGESIDKASLTENCVKLINIKHYLNKFLFYYLLSNKGQQQINEGIVGSTQPKLPIYNIERINIPEISIENQQHIVNTLGSIDEKIENNDLLSQKYESLLKNLYLKYFSKNNIDLSNYTQYNLTDLANFTGGYSYKGSELVPSSYGLLTIKNFDRNTGFKLDGFKDLSQENKAKNNQYIDQFDIVVAHTDLTQNAEIIGNAEIVLNKSSYKKLVASMDLVIVRPKEVISNSLLYILLHNPDFKKHALGYCAGTTVLHLNKRALNEYVVYLPKDKNIYNKIDALVGKIIQTQSHLIEQNIKLNELKKLYLKKFFG